jgi:hypothetical protein
MVAMAVPVVEAREKTAQLKEATLFSPVVQVVGLGIQAVMPTAVVAGRVVVVLVVRVKTVLVQLTQEMVVLVWIYLMSSVRHSEKVDFSRVVVVVVVRTRVTLPLKEVLVVEEMVRMGLLKTVQQTLVVVVLALGMMET